MDLCPTPVPDPQPPGCAHVAPAADALRYSPLQTQGQRSDHDATHRARLRARARRLRDAPPRPHQQGRAGQRAYGTSPPHHWPITYHPTTIPPLP
eukprot:COSAG01_NODE_2446_length_7684_cov_126.363564_2_plen_95_part_00